MAICSLDIAQGPDASRLKLASGSSAFGPSSLVNIGHDYAGIRHFAAPKPSRVFSASDCVPERLFARIALILPNPTADYCVPAGVYEPSAPELTLFANMLTNTPRRVHCDQWLDI